MAQIDVNEIFGALNPISFFRGQVTAFDGISDHTSTAKTGVLFFACPGRQKSAEELTEIALIKGVSGIVTTHDVAMEKRAIFSHITFFGVKSVPHAVAQMSRYLYVNQPAFAAAVTGTNGKTSIAHFTRQLWQLLGVRAASIGTLGVMGEQLKIPASLLTSLTTPSAMHLYPLLDALAHDGVKACVLETSSIGLDARRADAMHLNVGVFSSFSQDHLDFHGSMRAYWLSKTRLFKELIAKDGTAILHTSLPYPHEAIEACSRRNLTIWHYGEQETADVVINRVTYTPREGNTGCAQIGQTLEVSFFGREHTFWVPIVGSIHAHNLVAAILTVHASGHAIAEVLEVVAHVTQPEGRLTCVGSTPKGSKVFVDFAHTPDALKTVLRDVRKQGAKKIGVVFGCGGQRDPDKREPMGQIAAQHADFVIITDDNPRHENPEAIHKAILKGAPKARVIPSRAEAITAGMQKLGRDDVLLIAGKGHEAMQYIGDDAIPFSDIRFVQKVLSEMNTQATPGTTARVKKSS